jgi:hypothetical protein
LRVAQPPSVNSPHPDCLFEGGRATLS